MKEALFKDSTVNERFERDGFVVIDFTTTDIVKEIAKSFYALHPTIPDGFFCEVSQTDDNMKNELFLLMDKLLAEQMEATFANFKKLGSTFLCKAPGESGKVGVHQDWMVVDENRYSSATIWIPCQDVDEHNGALMVLPGSHLFFDKYRNNHIPVSYRGSESLILENMITVPMKAGQAFVLNHAVIHASTLNNTDEERLVIAYGITSTDAPLSFYFQEKDAPTNIVEQFEMPDDFFLRYYNIGERPLIGKMIASFEYEVPAIDGATITAMITAEKQKRRDIPFFKTCWPWVEPTQVQKASQDSWSLKISSFFKRLNAR